MTGARLRQWGRMAAARAPGRMLRYAAGIALTIAATALVATAADATSASARWRLVAVAALGGLMLAIPQWIFWRRDAALVARLPITGDALLVAAVRRAAVAGAAVVLVLVTAAVPLLAWSVPLALRHALAAVAYGVIVVAVLPAVSAGAAALVGSSHVAELARGVGGEVRAPTSSWLGILPGLVAAALVLGLLALGPWLRADQRTLIGDARVVLAIAVGVALLALAAATRAASGMAVALREVAALDRVRLAHLEIHPPSAVERMIIARIGRPAGLVLAKDARLMRRRYPMAWIVGAMLWGTGVVLALGWTSQPTMWTLVLGAVAGTYVAMLGARLHTLPIEAHRLTSSLPLSSAAVRLAKRAWLLAWVVVFAVPGLALAAVAAPLPAAIAAALCMVGVALAWLQQGRAIDPGH